MPVNYATDSRLKELTPILDEYGEWYGRVLRRIFYPESYAGKEELKYPESFSRWMNDTQTSANFSAILLDDLSRRHEALHNAAQEQAHSAMQSATKPAIDNFDSLTGLYEGFVLALRRLEYDCLLADSGLDALSGLRSVNAMKNDMERELERRARRGKPFCLAVARIDNFERLHKAVDEVRYKQIIRQLAGLIKQCLRTFDDAYRSADDEFVMSLKQTEMRGGSAAIERLRKMLIDADIVIAAPDGEYKLTMSYCVAEPLPGDTFDELLANMRADLGNYQEEANTALEYQEQSQLQRFIRTVQD